MAEVRRSTRKRPGPDIKESVNRRRKPLSTPPNAEGRPLSVEEREQFRILTGAAPFAEGLVDACREARMDSLIPKLREKALMGNDVLSRPADDLTDEEILGVMGPLVDVIRMILRETSEEVDVACLQGHILQEEDPEYADEPSDDDEGFTDSKEDFKEMLLLSVLHFWTATDRRMKDWPYVM